MPATTVSAAGLLDALGPALKRFLGARCRDPELANDLLQETALRVIVAEARLDADQNPRGYLFRTAANVWRDHVRRELTRRQAGDVLSRGSSAVAPAADERVLGNDLREAIRRLIAGLPLAQREVLELRHRGDLTFREIASRLRRPLGTVLTQMHSALDTIATGLEAYR